MTLKSLNPFQLALVGLLCCAPALLAQRSSGYYGGGGYSSYSRGSSGGSGSSSSTRDYQNNTMVGEASIAIDPETRRIIVITDDETATNVSRVIADLDKPKPQVLINVVFLEATYNNGLDLGVEGTYHGGNSG